jgi:aminopeptidase N
MDIASRPSTPIENPETADAAPPPQAPAVIRRDDYKAPDWLVPEIALDFALDPDATRVASTLAVRRTPAGGDNT